MDTFVEYRNGLFRRFEEDTKGVPEKWKIADNLVRKVSKDGCLQPFYGFTSIFDLNDSDSAKCLERYTSFMEGAGKLVIPLPASSFHITLHTFWNQNNSGSIEEVNRRMAVSTPEIIEVMKWVRKEYGEEVIRMVSPGISTAWTDVVSMKFIPYCQHDYDILSVLFARMERICPLRQPYVPHISFGYFNVKEYSMEEIERLNEAILSTNEKHDEALMTLNINSLRFCVHGDMSGYETVMRE